MSIRRIASAGSTDKNDIYIVIEPNTRGGIELILKSTMEKLYGEHIKKIVMSILNIYKIKDAIVKIEDKGAWDFTIKARMQAAIYRAIKK